MSHWCEQRSIPRGEVVPVERCWELARRWYAGRLEPDWRRHTMAEMEHIFGELGLTGPFWSLRGR